MNIDFQNIRLVPLASTLPRVSTRLGMMDYLGAVRVRLGIRREAYRIVPGLYAVGHPASASDVFVTANYKLSFDTLRKNLDGMDGWILVLDTKGINVWCAAGKKTFGTAELVRQIGLTSLDKIVSHKRLILPQLGAAGISAHKVRAASGFSVIYGPVRASDIKTFVSSGYKATKEMRRVHFGFTDRLILVPNDFIYGKYYLLAGMALVLMFSGLHKSGLSFQRMIENGPGMMMNVLYAYISGIVLTPVLLPWIPGRPFALKGFVTGFAVSLLLLVFQRLGNNYYEMASWLLMITGLSSFLAMNFTGSSTYTSLSGVKKEMRVAVPLQIAFAVTGLVLMTIGRMKV
jgi:hypothetical protein